MGEERRRYCVSFFVCHSAKGMEANENRVRDLKSAIRANRPLYSLDTGVSERQITAEVHEMTKRRYRRWEEARAEAEELRKRIHELRQEMPLRNGPLLREWAEPMTFTVYKYATLQRALKTGLPITAEDFEKKSGLRFQESDHQAHRAYRTILLEESDPVAAIADEVGVEESVIARLVKEVTPVEWTFLQRVHRLFLNKTNLADRVELALHFIEGFIPWTHGNWQKTLVSHRGISYQVTQRAFGLNDLKHLVDYVDLHTQPRSSADPQTTVKALLDAFECIWGLRVPKDIDRYLKVEDHSLRQWRIKHAAI